MIEDKGSHDIKREPIRKIKAPKRTLIKTKGTIPKSAERGIVTYSVGKVYLVDPLNSKSKFDKIECIPGGIIISENDSSTIVAVGDYVWFTIEESTDEIVGTIHKVEKRSTLLSRQAVGKAPFEHVIASNIDNLLILMAYKDPKYNRRLIDRFIVAAELGSIQPVICLNKIDLADEIDEFEEDFETYVELGIEIFYISALKNIGIDKLRDFLESRKVVLSGPSGAGKSTLLNRLVGKQVQAVREISDKTSKGRHATSYVRMFSIPGDTYIVDTPGIREFALWGVDRLNLPLFFHDFDPFFSNCKYLPCTHTHEPGCAVKDALEEGKIDPERYLSYLYLSDSLEE